MKTIAEIITLLQKPVSDQHMSVKRIKGNEIRYISWTMYCKILDHRCGIGNWEWAITRLHTTDDRLFVVGQLSIYGSDRVLTMDATGTEELSTSSYGDPSSNAEASALRRACAKLGLARSLWERE